MRDDPQIRTAQPADLDDIAELAGSKDRAAVRLQAAGRGEDSMLVAVATGVLLGVTSIRWADGCDPPHPWLYGLAVAETARGHGIGRALVRAAEAAAAARGATAMSLDTDVDARSTVAFYQHLGYRVIRGHEHHWRSLDPRTGAVTATGTAPTWIMRRWLTPQRHDLQNPMGEG